MIIDSCLIVKNEEKNLRHVIDHLLEFSSHIYIVDTGSTDSTIDIVKSYADTEKVHLNLFKWINDFSAARNFSISLSQGANYIFWCDGDETFSDDFVVRLKKFKEMEYSESLPDVYAYTMATKNDFDGSLTNTYNRVGIFKANKGIKFCCQVHESLDCGNCSIDYTFFCGDNMLLNHYDKVGNEILRNFQIFANIQNSRRLTCREFFYAGVELGNQEYATGAFLMLIESIMHKEWHTETIDALYRYISYYDTFESCRNVNSATIEDVTKHMFKEKMFNKCVLLMFASVLYKYEYYQLAYECAEQAYNMKDIGYAQLLYSYYYNEIECLFVLILSADKLGKHRTANIYNNIILELEPTNESALFNKKYFESLI